MKLIIFGKTFSSNYSVQRINDYMLPILNLHNSEEDFLLMFVPQPIRIYHENEISTKLPNYLSFKEELYSQAYTGMLHLN